MCQKIEFLVELRLVGSKKPVLQNAIACNIEEVKKRMNAIKEVKTVNKIIELSNISTPNICLRIDGLTHKQRNKIKSRDKYNERI